MVSCGLGVQAPQILFFENCNRSGFLLLSLAIYGGGGCRKFQKGENMNLFCCYREGCACADCDRKTVFIFQRRSSVDWETHNPERARKMVKKMPIRAALTRLRGAGKEHKTKTNLYADIVPTFR